MKQLYLKSIILAIFSLISITALAYDCKVDGILYNLDKTARTAEVTSGSTKYSGEVTIPSTITYNGTTYSVTRIGTNAFSYCSGLTSVVIPSSVAIIRDNAFSGCSGLTKVIVKDIAAWCNIIFCGSNTNPLRYAHHIYNDENTEITELIIPDGVTSIGQYAFYGCSGLTSIEIPSSVTSIGHQAFSYCSGLTSIKIPDSVTYIGEFVFAYCSGVTSVTIGNGVTNFGYHAFANCTALTSVTIGNGVTIISDYAFANCTALTSIVIPNSVITIGWGAFGGCTSLTSIEIPNSVTSIGQYAFYGCSGLTSIEIPNSVTSIGDGAFEDCNGLTSIVIPNSVTRIGDGAFEDCNGLTSIVIPNSVTRIERWVFKYCTGLTSIEIPSSVTSIGHQAFSYCSGLTSITIPNSVISIGYDAFYGTAWYNNQPDGLVYAGKVAYKYKGTMPANTSITLIEGTKGIADKAFLDCSGLTSIVIPNSVTSIGEEAFNGCSGLTSITIPNSVTYIGTGAFGGCSGLISSTTSTSISTGIYLEAGSSFSFTLTHNNKSIAVVKSGHIKYTGLDPMQDYTINGIGLSGKTKELTLTTLQPKVISAGNVIVAAESNLDDEETKFGFEWRRTDWTDDFASNTGTAYLYNGTMEGYIRNLYTEKLWKYRPYYTSNAGNTYYGEWVGIDPTNTSYFEPTVHTYANVSVNGNSAEVKGYVQRGTDNVVSKGFAYWEQSQGVKSREAISSPSKISSLPSNVKTIEVSGNQQVMTASLPNLEYETTYCYVAFVKTSEGDTFYGDVRSFATGEDLTGIENVEVSSHEQAIEVARYNINGHRISSPQRGINIVHMSDGTTRKVFVK